MAKEMNIHLQADYKTYNGFCPLYAPDGQLTAVEMLTHFTHTAVNVSIPQQILIPQLDERQRVQLLQNKINIIEKHHDFFTHESLNVAIHIDRVLAETLLDSDLLLKKMHQLDCIELEVSEDFPDIKAGKENDFLLELSKKFNLTLNNYGAGQATSKAVFDNLFYRIKLDKGFISQNIKRRSFRPFISAILVHIKPHCQDVVVQGIDSPAELQIVRQFAFDGIQGEIFPAVNEEKLMHLLERPYQLQAVVI